MTRFQIVMLLTYVRAPLAIASAAAAVINLFYPHFGWIVTTVLLLAISAFTDFLDGKYARKWNVVTRIGKLLDPLMDKMFFAVSLPTAMFIAMFLESTTHAIILLILEIVSALRDQWVSFLRSVGSGLGADVKAIFVGKLRTFLAMPIIIVIHVRLGLEVLQRRSDAHEGINILIPNSVLYSIEIVFLLLTIVSAVIYTLQYLPYLKLASKHDLSK